MLYGNKKIAVLIPCYNEEKSIVHVVESFREHLPEATIVVCDNNSSDNTADQARKVADLVLFQPMQGKGHALRRMFSEVEADVYVMVDGDATYQASSAPSMINLLIENHLDMVNGKRVEVDQKSYRTGHRLGNLVFSKTVCFLFGNRIQDLFSGYRVFSRRFIKSFPLQSKGFQVETEITVHALEMEFPVAEVETEYYARGEGSTSKLRTYQDGFKIALAIFGLFFRYKPMHFMSVLALSVLFLQIIGAVEAEVWILVPLLLILTGAVIKVSAQNTKELKQIAYLNGGGNFSSPESKIK